MAARPAPVSLGALEAALVAQLRATFLPTLYEPIPPRIVELLEALFDDDHEPSNLVAPTKS